MKCPGCGDPMRDLFSGVFCPNGCDKKAAPVELDTETTKPFKRPTDAAVAALGARLDACIAARCPKCASYEVEPFDDQRHCWDCGAVFP